MKPVFVYLMGNNARGWYKIGISDKPTCRLANITLPFKLELLAVFSCVDRNRARTLEKALHLKHKSKHLHREWFGGDVTAVQQVFEKECNEELQRIESRYSSSRRIELPRPPRQGAKHFQAGYARPNKGKPIGPRCDSALKRVVEYLLFNTTGSHEVFDVTPARRAAA